MTSSRVARVGDNQPAYAFPYSLPLTTVLVTYYCTRVPHASASCAQGWHAALSSSITFTSSVTDSVPCSVMHLQKPARCLVLVRYSL